MRLRRAIALMMLMILAATIAQDALCQEPGGNPETALPIKLIPGEISVPESSNYVLDSMRSQQYFKLEGVQAGYRLIIEVEVLGIEQGRAAISLYKESGEIIMQKKIQYGAGTSEKTALAYQPSLESAPPGSTHYLALSLYSGSMKYRLKFTLESLEDYGPGKGDAGSSPEYAINLPDLSPGKTIELKGHLASLDDGGDTADRVDYYLMRVRFNNSKSILRIKVDPLDALRISASLYMDDHRITYGSSREPGGEVNLDISGEWKIEERYNFIIRVDNLADKNGGAYMIRAWIEEPNVTEQATEIKPPGELDERTLTLIVMVGAASLIAISIIMIFLRRRRIYRVEEVGWWGY